MSTKIIKKLLLFLSLICSESKIVCREGRYSCNDGVNCIYDHEVCDSHKDCDDGDDELNCTKTASQCLDIEYFCISNSRCISERWLCDGDDDCSDAADENPDICTRSVKSTVSTPKPIVECKEYSCSFSKECIPRSKVCDGTLDCSDLTDEGRFCSNSCFSDNGGCSQICQKSPTGPKCSCFDGYSLSYDGKTCKDLNECEIPGICSHYCNNSQGGFKCSCAEGYFLDFDNKKCKAVSGAATFVYMLPDQIKGIDLSTMSLKVYVSGDDMDIRGMDYDASEDILFWADWKHKTINSFTNTTKQQDVLLTTAVSPRYLRWDWIAKNIYYIDGDGSIICCSKDGRFCTTVIHNASKHISSIDISPLTGFLFWSVIESAFKNVSAVLERADMDGSYRMAIVSDRVVWPIAVTVDHILEMVYWIDSKLNIMECADFQGMKRRTVVAEGLYHYHYSMTMFEDHIYLSDWGTDSLIRCDKFNGKNCTYFHRGNVKAEVVMVIHKMMQPKGLNRCAINLCPHLCLLTRTNFTCKCDNSYENSTCELKPRVIKPIPTTSHRSCPDHYCQQDATCVVVDGQYNCQCPHPFKGDKCELQKVDAVRDVYDYRWVIGGLMGTAAICLIVAITFMCKRNRYIILLSSTFTEKRRKNRKNEIEIFE